MVDYKELYERTKRYLEWKIEMAEKAGDEESKKLAKVAEHTLIFMNNEEEEALKNE